MANLFVVPKLHRPARPEIDAPALREQFAKHVEQATLSMLDPDRIQAIGEDLGVVRKHRVHHAGMLVCAMILAALQRGSDFEGRWLDVQAVYRALGGPDSGSTSIRKMGRRMRAVMNELMRRRMAQLIAETRDVELCGRLREFRNVLIADGCAFKLASALSGIYPGTGQPAELKLHAVYNVKAGTATSVLRSAGSIHDSDGFWPERWEAGALYLWDLGYNSYKRFLDAALAGAHVVQRLKEKANPVVLRSYGRTGAPRSVLGDDGEYARLDAACVLGLLHQQPTLDLDVRLEDGGRTLEARVVCLRIDGEDYWYLTTLPREVFTPHDLAEMYRVRWEVELFFKGWKGGARLDHVHRLKNADSLAVAVTASMLAALLSRDLHARLEQLAEQAASSAAAVASGGFPPSAHRAASA